ncbi:MAG: DUF362 domain-containing protein [Polyangiaceae bacterium]|nr:DUF362 domain-containing protein [Polyangiaceae bacterium]
MGKRLTRRNIVVGAGALLGVGAATTGLVYWKKLGPLPVRAEAPDLASARRDFRVPPQPGAPTLAIATGAGGAAALAERAVVALGGLGRFVARGDVVCVKPNIGWARTPGQAANTSPDVVAYLVRAALAAGAKRVVVTDRSCNDPVRSFEASGIAAAASDAGAEILVPGPEHFVERAVRGRILDSWPLLEPALSADKLINVPVAKNHGSAQLTAAMKNWFGVLGGERGRLHSELDVAIADIAAHVRPTLTVVDATTVMVKNGPRGGSLDDLVAKDTVLASLDEVAADAFAATLVGLEPSAVGYLALGEALGLGTRDWSSLGPVRV